MALDTREKRQNAAGCGRPWMRHPLPVGATDEQSRIARGHGYGGNALTPTAGATQSITLNSPYSNNADPFQTVIFQGGIPTGDGEIPRLLEIRYYGKKIPRHGYPGLAAVLHIDGKSPELYFWDHVKNRWFLIH